MDNITTIIFDWGDTLMRDYPELSGPMCSWNHVEIIPNVDTVIQELSKKYRLIVAANADESDAHQIALALERVMLKDYFTDFFSSKDIGVKKPHIDFFNHIFKQTSVQPHECIMIGNTYEKDIVGGKNAGMTTIFFNEFNSSGNYPLADYTIINTHEILDIIK